MSRTRRRRRGRDGSGASALGLALIGLAGAALAGLAGAATLIRPPPVDAETGCRLDAPTPAHTLVLVDATDRLEARHVRRLTAALHQERDALPLWGRLTVLRMDARAPRDPRRLISLCNPGDGRSVNPLVANTRDAQRRWESGFVAPLEDAARAAASGGRGRSSPLVEALAAAAADPDFGPASGARRLVFVSDLLEHHPGGFSLLADGADLAAFKISEEGRRTRLALEGVTVRVVTLDREEHSARQIDAKERFWAPLLAESGAAAAFDVTP